MLHSLVWLSSKCSFTMLGLNALIQEEHIQTFKCFSRTCSVVSLKRSNFHTSLTSTQGIGQCTNQSFCQLKLLDWILQRGDPREEDI